MPRYPVLPLWAMRKEMKDVAGTTVALLRLNELLGLAGLAVLMAIGRYPP